MVLCHNSKLKPDNSYIRVVITDVLGRKGSTGQRNDTTDEVWSHVTTKPIDNIEEMWKRFDVIFVILNAKQICKSKNSLYTVKCQTCPIFWIKIDELNVTCFIISPFTSQHVSNVSTSIFRSLRLIVDLCYVLYCCGSMCVGVTVWFSASVLQPASGYHTTPAEPHRDTNTHRTRAIQPMK